MKKDAEAGRNCALQAHFKFQFSEMVFFFGTGRAMKKPSEFFPTVENVISRVSLVRPQLKDELVSLYLWGSRVYGLANEDSGTFFLSLIGFSVVPMLLVPTTHMRKPGRQICLDDPLTSSLV